MRTGLKRTTKHVHMTQFDGLQIDRTIYTDGEKEFIKINGFVFDLLDFSYSDFRSAWRIDFIW